MSHPIPDQKSVMIMKGSADTYLTCESVGDTYLTSQCDGNSGLQQDLNFGWRIKHIFEDRYWIVLIMEKTR